jgi:type II secretory pathway pseudopilin PulG
MQQHNECKQQAGVVLASAAPLLHPQIRTSKITSKQQQQQAGGVLTSAAPLLRPQIRTSNVTSKQQQQQDKQRELGRDGKRKKSYIWSSGVEDWT